MKPILITLLSLSLSAISALSAGLTSDTLESTLAAERERQARLSTVKGNVIMNYIAEDSQEFNCGYIRDFENGARLEIRGILGEILFVVTANSNDMMIYSKPKKSAIVCPATRENLSSLLGLDMGGNIFQLLDWISGVVPLLDENDGFSAQIESNGDGRKTVKWHDGAGNPVKDIAFDDTSGIPTAARLYDPEGQALADIVYSDYNEIDGILFAESVTVTTDSIRLEVSFYKVSINDSVPVKAFSTEPPDGVEVLSVEDAVAPDETP